MDLIVIVAFLGVVATLVGVFVTRMNAREAIRRQNVGADQWMRDLRDWASEAIDVLSEAVYASDSSDVRRYISQLSALVDRGRFFLPNQVNENDEPENENDEPEKLPAFQGRRHRALVPLIAALRVLDGEVENELKEYVSQKRSDVIRGLQREFVSHIQQILDSRQRNQEIITQLIERSDEQVVAIYGVVGTGAKARLRDVVKRIRKTNKSLRQ